MHGVIIDCGVILLASSVAISWEFSTKCIPPIYYQIPKFECEIDFNRAA